MSATLANTLIELGVPLRVKADGNVDGRHFIKTRTPNEKGRKYKSLLGQRAHRLIVEARTGIKLPDHAVVHHVDRNDKRTNVGAFVVCEDFAYHGLIERRTRAWEACGNANWHKCRKCGRYDDPANMQSKVYEGRFGPLLKYWHYRYWNRCVDADHPVKHTRPHVPRKRKHVAAWRLAKARSAGTPNRSECPLSPLGPTPLATVEAPSLR